MSSLFGDDASQASGPDGESADSACDGVGRSADEVSAERSVPVDPRMWEERAAEAVGWWPGCHQPAVRCDVDHRIEYCEGGPTTEDNGQALCSRHNRLKERIRKLMARRRRRQELGRPPPPPPLRRSTGRAGPDRRSPAGPPDPGVP